MASDLNQHTQNLRSGIAEQEVTFSYPLSIRFPISQRFGENPNWYKRFGIATGHNGVDYAVPTRTPVLASGGGIVIKTGFDPDGYGKYIKITHNGSYISLYAHLEEIQVKNNQHVETGQQIGLSGSTGFSTGPHLHFEIRKDNAAIDPELLLLSFRTAGLRQAQPIDQEVQPAAAVVTVPVLNIRCAPSVSAPLIGHLQQGQQVTILERITSVWVKIAGHENAYVAHTFENIPYLQEQNE